MVASARGAAQAARGLRPEPMAASMRAWMAATTMAVIVRCPAAAPPEREAQPEACPCCSPQPASRCAAAGARHESRAEHALFDLDHARLRRRIAMNGAELKHS
jgi:hypothetical protein